ncbi:MAG: MerR family transcriptional regulator [Pirellulaceae bacterium]|jgi:hypothetical protein|nr:MerR family transcriptional regulator [Pirellulaceae bacterium]
MSKHANLIGSGEVARQYQLPRWRLLYHIDRGNLPEPSFRVAGRRLFSEQDLKRIAEALTKNPELFGNATADKSTNTEVQVDA